MLKSALENSSAQKNSYNVRIFLLLACLTLLFGCIGIKLFNLQILDHKTYLTMAANQHQSTTSLMPTRGQIYLEPLNNSPLLAATTVSKNMVYGVPKEISDKMGTANKLASILNMTGNDVLQKISGDGGFVVIQKIIDDSAATKLKNLKLKGIYLQSQDVRFYPENDLASQVIGFVGYKGDQRVGQYGIEEKFQNQLAGKPGVLDASTDPTGRWITTSSRSFVPATDGDDVYLTIDPAIQFKAESVLKDAILKHGADGGSAIVVDPQTGAILAMASEPGFDLNNYSKVKNISIYNNQAIAGDYEPGSVFKAITMAAALNEKKITPLTTYTDVGSVKIDDKVIKNSNPKPLGEQTMIQVLDESLNTGAIFAEQQIGNDTFKSYVRKFGFGQNVNIGLPGQSDGNLDNLNKKGDVFFATASFGQGISVTPLQMIQAYTAIAHGGKIQTPYIVDKIIHPDGNQEHPRPDSNQQILSEQAAAQISSMLVDVVENGHGKQAQVKGYYIAGKTGTAQVPYKDKQGYDPDTNIGSFIGFGPVDNPKFLAFVRVDNPKDVKFAESTAAPAFGDLAQFILNYMQVPPSR